MALEGLICSGSPNRPHWAFAEPDGSMGIHGAEMLRCALPCPQTKIDRLFLGVGRTDYPKEHDQQT